MFLCVLYPQAFRQLSHRFHGKGSGKMKTERRMKKLDEEAVGLWRLGALHFGCCRIFCLHPCADFTLALQLLKKMSSSDTPLGTVALLQEKQKAQKTPYIVLSGSGKSMNA